jgi:hypothetical protein
LTTIYRDAGYLLLVQENDTSIAPLTGSANPSDPNQYDYITEAELDSLESANRGVAVSPASWSCGWWIFNTTCSQYFLYGIVVNHYYEDNDGVR